MVNSVVYARCLCTWFCYLHCGVLVLVLFVCYCDFWRLDVFMFVYLCAFVGLRGLFWVYKFAVWFCLWLACLWYLVCILGLGVPCEWCGWDLFACLHLLYLVVNSVGLFNSLLL